MGSRIDALQSLHSGEGAILGSATFANVLAMNWPEIYRVLAAARELRRNNNVSDWVLTPDWKLTDHGKLFRAIDELEREA